MSNSAAKRRNYLIKNAFQGRYVVGVLMLMLLSGLCSALLVYWLIGSDLHAQSESAHVSIANAWDRLGLSVLIANTVAILFAGAIAIYTVMHASHKIAGPLYRFEKLCREVGNGNLEVITTLREKDQLQDLSMAFMDMLNDLKARKRRQQACIENISRQIEELKSDRSLTAQQREALEQLKSTVARFDF